jgi:CheY-like chemotaxis protein
MENPSVEHYGVLHGYDFLVVDDNIDVAFCLEELLKELGATVRVALGGRQAMEQLISRIPDIMISDIEMPDISGYDLAQQVRASYRGDCPLLVAHSGLGRERGEAKAIAAGFDDFIPKPLSTVDIFALLENFKKAPLHS